MKSKKNVWLIGAVAAVATLVGCASSKAPMGSTGAKIEVLVLSDRGQESAMEAEQWRYRNEVGAYMERDLVNRLNRTGYTARLIKSQEEFSAAPDRCLVSMAIKSYNPGSAAARMIVGMGAGACSVDMHYKVLGEDGSVVMEWDDGIGTSGHWSRLANGLNDRLVRKLNETLASGR